MPRRGFTLVELLVACGVFLFGFTAAFAMFLAGTRARSQADGIIRLSLAASSLAEEFKLEAGRESLSTPGAPVPFPPNAYIGDGFAAVHSVGTAAAEDPGDMTAPLFQYRPQPGVWYRVISCTDEKGSPTDPFATALQMELLVVWNPAPDATLTLDDLAKRQRMDLKPTWAGLLYPEQLSTLVDFLAQRGFAVREQIVFIRRPSWER